jgi:septum formation inhibitor MinC
LRKVNKMDLTSEDQKLDEILRREQENAESAGSSVRVYPLDPDFLVILCFIAIPFDFVIAALALLDVFSLGISWIIRMVVAVPPLLAIGAWHYMRASKLSKAKSDAWSKFDKIAEEVKKHRESLRAKQQMAEFKKSLKLTKSKGMFAKQQLKKKTLTETGKKTITKTTVKRTAVKMGSKIVLKRGTIALLGTITPLFVAIIPFYTLWMLSTLKDK